MVWALIISNFNVSLSTEILWISLRKSFMNFKQLGGRGESRLAESNAGVTERLSLGSIDCNREYSTSAERKFLVVAVVVEVVAVVNVVAAVVVVDEQ
jgi:hypothetical protein